MRARAAAPGADRVDGGWPEPTGEPSDEPPDAAFECRRTEVSAAQHGARLDKVLVELAPEFSRSHLQHLLERGHVRLEGHGGASLLPARRMRAGERIELELVPTDESRAFRAEAIALKVLHEDEHIVVLDKPAGLVVHPAPGHWSGTLLNALLAHHAGAVALPRAGIVHRLDKDTSGLMVVGKTLPAVTALVRDIAARQVQRHYLALVHGVPSPSEIRIEAPIGRDPRSRVRMAIVSPAAGGRAARTDVRVLAACIDAHLLAAHEADEGVAALECRLHTGRTHQIRVHLASRGHPLVADALYGGRPLLGLMRQALHAARLTFEHPVTRAPLDFSCPPPEDFALAWRQVAGATMRASPSRRAAGT